MGARYYLELYKVPHRSHGQRERPAASWAPKPPAWCASWLGRDAGRGEEARW